MSDSPPPPPFGADPNQPPPAPPYPPSPYQQPYAQPGQPVPYGAPQSSGGYASHVPDHPQATTVLVLGILGVCGVCGLLSPIAWVMGNRVVREIDASHGQLGGRTNANAGRICGIIGTLLIGLAVVVALIVLAVAISSSTSNY